MKLSIIVPVYNARDYLKQCVDSLLAQTIDDYEIILVDDGATDGSGELVSAFADEHPERIKAIHIDNGGQGRARNFGIEAAKGEYIGFVDSDDWVAPEMFTELCAAAESAGANMAACDCIEVYPDGRRSYFSMTGFRDISEVTGAVWNKLFRRSVIGELRFPEGLWYEDLEFVIRFMLKAGEAVKVQKGLYYYRRGQTSTMNNKNAVKNLDIIPVMETIRREMLLLGMGRELDRLMLDHVLLDAINRVSEQSVEGGEKVIAQLRAYVRDNIPDLLKCEAYKREHFKRKIVMYLNYHGMHRVAKAIFGLKRSVSS